MDFTCPHCGKTFYAPTRRGSDSEKQKEAARRNGKLGGRKSKVSDAVAGQVYAKQAVWQWQDFVAALKKASGVELSRGRAFVLLRKLKAVHGSGKKVRLQDIGKRVPDGGSIAFNDGGLDEPVSAPEKSSRVVRGKKAAR